jgi:hypothetical protein
MFSFLLPYLSATELQSPGLPKEDDSVVTLALIKSHHKRKPPSNVGNSLI